MIILPLILARHDERTFVEPLVDGVHAAVDVRQGRATGRKTSQTAISQGYETVDRRRQALIREGRQDRSRDRVRSLRRIRIHREVRIIRRSILVEGLDGCDSAELGAALEEI